MNRLKDFGKVKGALALKMPFCMALISKRPIIIGEDITNTMAVDEAGNIYINPEFYNSLEMFEAMFILAHEAMHVMLDHAGRMKGRHPKLWNYAADGVINAVLESKKIGKFRYAEGVWIPEALEMTTEELYNKLLREWQGKTKCKPDEGQEGWEQGEKEYKFKRDVLEGDHSDPNNRGKKVTPAQRQEVRDAVAAAVHQAEVQGDMPEGIGREIGSYTKPKSDWTDQLTDYLTQRTPTDYSWRRPNRRYMHGGLYLPSLDGQTLGSVAIAVDTSGSITQELLDMFAGHIQLVLDVFAPEKIRVIYCDYIIQKEETFERGDELKLKAAGGGGTSFLPVFNLLEQESDKPDVLIYITDGYCYGENIPDQEYPVVWLTTGNDRLSPGKVIKI